MLLITVHYTPVSYAYRLTLTRYVTSRFTLGSAEIPQNAIVTFNPVHDGLNIDELTFLQWHTNQSACGMNVYDVSVQCENTELRTHCMRSPAAGTTSCLETHVKFCFECSIIDAPSDSSCHAHSANNVCPTITPSFSASNTQYSQSNIPLTFESTATIVSSPAIVTSTTQYSSTSMTHDSPSVDFSSSSSADLISPSPSPTSLYCPPDDPPWPLTPAGYDASLNSTCHYGLFNGI